MKLKVLIILILILLSSGCLDETPIVNKEYKVISVKDPGDGYYLVSFVNNNGRIDTMKVFNTDNFKIFDSNKTALVKIRDEGFNNVAEWNLYLNGSDLK